MQDRFMKRSPTGWDNIEPEGYVAGVTTKVVRHTLIGGRKATPDASGPALEVRYFALPPGAVTRLEKHEHEHFVIVGQGVGEAIVGHTVREVRQHDVIYVAALEAHQFVNSGAVPFGFFCIVTAHRDIAQALAPAELAALLASPAGRIADPDCAPAPRP